MDQKRVLDSLSLLLLSHYQHISNRRRIQFFFLLVLTIIASIAEVVSLGAVVPFIGILTQPEKVFQSPLMSGVIQTMGINSADDLVLPLTIGFAVAALAAGGLRLLLLWVSIRLANATGADLSVEVYRRTLYQPYSIHVARSSSEIISGITQKVQITTSVLASLVTVFTSVILFVAILMTLLAIDPVVAGIAVLSFGSCYLVIVWLTRRRLKANSQCIANQQTLVVKSLQEGLGAIRDVLLDSTQLIYSDNFQRSVQKLMRATGENQYITLAPRFIMEALGMTLVAIFAYMLSFRQGGIGAALPVLGALALAVQRLLPLLQQLYANWSYVVGSQAALKDVFCLLEQPLPEDAFLPALEPMVFSEAIVFEDVHFQYNQESPSVLKEISFEIKKGGRVGFVGSTGSGKSTALDLLMSLLEPNQGRILVDGQMVKGNLRRAWQQTIAHVPQSIYLADATIAENIAFGVPPELVDIERVREAARQAKIADFIESQSEAYSMIVGERGVRLSGGQRQRIGIARALYKQATVLIFDEATSALDNETEREVMQAIENLDRELTVLIVAHRLTTLQHCDAIVKFDQGKLIYQGTYNDLMNSEYGGLGLEKTAS